MVWSLRDGFRPAPQNHNQARDKFGAAASAAIKACQDGRIDSSCQRQMLLTLEVMQSGKEWLGPAEPSMPLGLKPSTHEQQLAGADGKIWKLGCILIEHVGLTQSLVVLILRIIGTVIFLRVGDPVLLLQRCLQFVCPHKADYGLELCIF